MEKRHELMGGKVQLFTRPNSKFWYCEATVGGRQRRISTKKENLALAKDVAKDWYLTLEGKAHACSATIWMRKSGNLDENFLAAI